MCGDGHIFPVFEQCDDSDATSGDGCSNLCNIEIGFACLGEPSICTTVCGDGVLMPAVE
ncbi:MAG: DUF4215 domain-containing protein [Streptococcus sp.]|nr:DUF4215 domain-containing protein [Streptococcus sp.]